MIIAFFLFLSSFFSTKTPAIPTINTSAKTSQQNQVIGNDKNFVLLELFTSEGCSSCPAADEALLDLAKQPNVYALGYHVSYWNRLGWTDAYSKKSFDERQYQYGDRFKSEGVYTPEVIINGSDATVGSRKAYIQEKINIEQNKLADATITLNKNLQNETDLTVDWSIAGKTKNNVINVAIVESDIATKVKRGENSGRILRHINIVRDIVTQNIGTNLSGQTKLTIQKDWNVPNLKLIAFTQESGLGKITGATSINLQ